MSAYNEADIISPVIGHLVENGVEVYLLDHGSTDGTAGCKPARCPTRSRRKWLPYVNQVYSMKFTTDRFTRM